MTIRTFDEQHRIDLATIDRARNAGYAVPNGATFAEAIRGAEGHLERLEQGRRTADPLDLTDREQVRRYLDAMVDRADPEFSTYDPAWLRRYHRHVRRWLDCAPDGARFLIAPLTGWQGEPFSRREPQGPHGCPGPALRAARVARGLFPFGPADFRVIA